MKVKPNYRTSIADALFHSNNLRKSLDQALDLAPDEDTHTLVAHMLSQATSTSKAAKKLLLREVREKEKPRTKETKSQQ